MASLEKDGSVSGAEPMDMTIEDTFATRASVSSGMEEGVESIKHKKLLRKIDL